MEVEEVVEEEEVVVVVVVEEEEEEEVAPGTEDSKSPSISIHATLLSLSGPPVQNVTSLKL